MPDTYINGRPVISGYLERGSAAEPALKAIDDIDTGVYWLGSNALAISLGGSGYRLAEGSVAGQIALRNLTAAEQMGLVLETQDADGTDDVFYEVYGVGTAQATNRERLFFGWDAANSYYEIGHEENGTGTARPIVFTMDGTESYRINIDGTVTFALASTWTVEDAVTNAVTTVITINHNSSGVPADGLGTGFDFGIETSTTGAVLAGSIDVIWTTVAHATRRSDMILSVENNNDGVMEEFLRLDGSASEVAIANGINLVSGTTDGSALGTTSLGWADLHLATGAVINWANGEVTITETDADTLTVVGTALIDIAAGIFELNNAVRFDTGVAIVAASYSVGRDADGTNQLHLNVPTGATFELSINDVAEVTLSATVLDVLGNTIDNAAIINSNATNPADAGVLRLGNTEIIAWRNAANGGNITVAVNASDQLEFAQATTIVTTTGNLGVAPASGDNFVVTMAGDGFVDIGLVTYLTATGGVDIVRTGNFVGVATETAIDLQVAPSLTLTEPGAGAFTWYMVNFDFSGVAVTAGAGTSTLVGLRIVGNTDADVGTAYALLVDAGDTVLDANLVVGGSTSRTETLANAGFSLGGDDLFVAGDTGVEGDIYTDGSLIVGNTVAAAGAIRLINAAVIGWRNFGNSADHNVTFNASDQFVVDIGGTDELLYGTGAFQFQVSTTVDVAVPGANTAGRTLSIASSNGGAASGVGAAGQVGGLFTLTAGTGSAGAAGDGITAGGNGANGADVLLVPGTGGAGGADGGAGAGTAGSNGAIRVNDNTFFVLGTDKDSVLYHSSAVVNADTALAGVLIGTPESQALAANSLLISNVTASGDIAVYVNNGGNSQMAFLADGSTGDTLVLAASGASVDFYVAGVKELDYSTGAMAFQQATTISTSSGNVTVSAAAGADVLIGDDVTLVYVDGGVNGGVGGVGVGQVAADGVMLLAGWSAYTMASGTTAARHVYTQGNVTELVNATITDIVGAYFNTFTITDGGGTETVGIVATVYIPNAPTAGTTPADGPYALFVDAGSSRFDGDVNFGANLVFNKATNDLTVIVTDQATGARQATIPDLGSTNSTFAFLEQAQTFTAAQTIAVGADGPLTVTQSQDAASVQVAILQGNRATPTDADAAYISLLLSDSAGNQDEQARITWQATTVLSGATQDGDLILSALVNGVLTTFITLDGSASQLVPAVGINAAGITSPDLGTVTTIDINGGTVDSLTSLSIRSTGAAFDLTFATATVFGAGRTLTIDPGDASRTITLSGNPTLADWFDQDVKTTSNPTFVNLTITSFAANWTNAGRTVADLGTVTTVDINGGTVDGVTIGGAVAGAITGTTIDATTDFTIGGTVITDGSIADTGVLVINPITAISLGTGEAGTVAATGTTLRAPDITTGGLGNIAGADLTIAAGIGTGTGDVGTVIISLPIVAAVGDFIQTRVTAWTFDMVGSATVATLVLNANTIVSGTWNDLGIVTTVDLNGGTIDGATIGATSATTGVFTTVTASTSVIFQEATNNLTVVASDQATGARQATIPDLGSTDSTFAFLEQAQTWTAAQTVAVGADGPLTVTQSQDAASVQVAIFEGNRATPTDDDAAYISLRLSDSAGNQDEQARITWQATTVLNGATQDGDLAFSALFNGALTEMIRLDGSTPRIEFAPDGTDRLYYSQGAFAFQEATIISTSTGNLTLDSNGTVIIGPNADFTIGTANQNALFNSATATQRGIQVSYSNITHATADVFAVGIREATMTVNNGADGYWLTIGEDDTLPGTINVAASATAPVVASLFVNEPNISLGAGAGVTTAASVYIKAAPTEGDVNYALFIEAGTSRFDGNFNQRGDLELQQAANGQVVTVKTVSATHTANSGTGTETISNAIPAGAVVLGVTVRVTTILAGAGLTTWSIGLSGDTDRWGTGLALAAGTTTTGTAFASDVQPTVYPAATNIVLTAAAGQFDSGVVRYTVHYYDFTAATS